MPPAKIRIIDRLFKREPDETANLLASALKDPSHAPAFFKALLNSPLHALMLKGELLAFADAQGQAFIPIFTRKKLLPAAPEGAETIEKPGRDLLELARGMRVVINAGQKNFKLFGPEDLDRILDRLVKSRFEV